MRVSAKGKDLIKSYEGCRLKAYLCPAGVWTIGYGSTGPHVFKGKVITRQEAEDLLDKDLERFEEGVLKYCKPSVPSQSEFDAMVSLSFNIGLANFKSSSVLRNFKIGDKVKAANSFTLWNKARNPKTGKLEPLAGLTRRRADEKQLFLADAADRKVERSTGAKIVSVPEASVVPEAPKSLAKSREIIGGGIVGLGGIGQIIDSITVDDATQVKTGIEEIRKEDFIQHFHLAEVASGITVIVSLFIIWKRFKDRREGVR